MNTSFADDIAKALETLRSGGIILYPTDTIPMAVKRIYEIKQREDTKSMLILLENPNLLNSYITEVPEIAWDLIEVANNPLTIIYSGAKNLATNLLAYDGSIGIRITNEPFTQQLIQRFRKPVVSTSANISGQKSPHNFTEINDEIKKLVDYIVVYRQDDFSRSNPSDIIKLGVGGQIEIIR
jgi:L-threonylcarbamoyladenylate synthase